MGHIYFNKLIRDKIPEQIEKRGTKYKVSKLDDDKFTQALRDKLIEEALKFQSAKSKEDVVNELSDILELINTISKNSQITFDEIEKHKNEKNKKVGVFGKKLLLEYVDELDPSRVEKQKEDCVFCKFSKKDENKFWEDRYFFARLDSYPVTSGHATIIPKRHIVSLLDINQEEWFDLFKANRVIVGLIEKMDLKKVYTEMVKRHLSDKSVEFLSDVLESPRISSKPDAYNFGINDGREAGRTVDHLHWHIIPRYRGDVEDPTGGVRYVIPEKGNYKK